MKAVNVRNAAFCFLDLLVGPNPLAARPLILNDLQNNALVLDHKMDNKSREICGRERLLGSEQSLPLTLHRAR